MVPDRETADRRERARSAERAECLEMMVAIGSQGLGDCPNWVVMELEDCERTRRRPAADEKR
ncbi:hypothetical protein [Shinella pollutisoli]|uniref:Uncharacterized protein n=1 Tax=Shinella pollutisoli TaxID=2250594 RepID=A0ABV7DL18_9HYPH|nr:hypothetical protein [Shinella pollutisoli]